MNKQDEEKARELSKKFARQYHANNWPEWSDDEAFHYSNEEINNACLEMAQWKDEQLESKLMQIIILAQQGYTSGATDEMILKHCKEIINENYEHNTTKTD